MDITKGAYIAALCICLFATSLFAEEPAASAKERAQESAQESAQVSAEAAEGSRQSIAEVLGAEDFEEGDQYTHIEQRIANAEAASAVRELEVLLDQIEAVQHQSHPDLVRPLTLLGDAQVAQGEYGEALETYGRARYITRVNSGLFHPSQLDLVYRVADTHSRTGDMTEARNHEEYAYEILKKTYEQYDAGLIPGLERLARFYLKTYNYLAARVFFKRAMAVHSANGTHLTTAAIPALRGIAYTYRMERFPPFYIASSQDSRASGPTPGLDDSELGMQHYSINNFPEGERALQAIVEIVQSQVPANPDVIRASILDLADWHLLWDRSSEANTLYSYIFNELAAIGEDPDEVFGEPSLVYLPMPRPPKPPPPGRRLAEEQGLVTLQFQVTQNGRIRKLKTVHSHPPKMMEFQIRRSMRSAVFRPQLINGVPQTVDEHTYTYEFPYFPSSASMPAAARDRPEADSTRVDPVDREEDPLEQSG